MVSDFLPGMGVTLRAERRRRGWSQADLAERLGRAPARISELERDLKTRRLGRDRLTLLTEICDALDLVMILRPRNQLAQTLHGNSAPSAPGDQRSVFDDVFVDLSDAGDADG